MTGSPPSQVFNYTVIKNVCITSIFGAYRVGLMPQRKWAGSESVSGKQDLLVKQIERNAFATVYTVVSKDP